MELFNLSLGGQLLRINRVRIVLNFRLVRESDTANVFEILLAMGFKSFE